MQKFFFWNGAPILPPLLAVKITGWKMPPPLSFFFVFFFPLDCEGKKFRLLAHASKRDTHMTWTCTLVATHTCVD